jgi:hypothetical protein
MFLSYVWNSFIALLNLIVIAINTLRRGIKVTSLLDIVWSDGDFGPDVYWKSQELLAW